MTDYSPNPWILDSINANVKWMNSMMDGIPVECLSDCEKEIKALREALEVCTKERDEARREVCRREGIIRMQRNHVHRDSEEIVLKANEISVERGWDCFKEDTDGTS